MGVCVCVCLFAYAVWVVWAFLASADTALVHSGWHLPWLPSPEGHDYHHSSGFIDNLGVIGTLDALFHTNTHYLASWQVQVDKTYSATADYPVDKVLCSGGKEEDPQMSHGGKRQSPGLELG